MSNSTPLAAWRKVIGKGLVLSIEHHDDADAYWTDGSYGKWGNTSSSVVYGDRKLGVLRGPAKTTYETFKTEDAAEDRIAELEDEGCFSGEIVWTPTRVYYQITDHDTSRIYYHSQPFETEHDYDEWRWSMSREYGAQYTGGWYIMDETRKEWKIEVYGDEILSRDGFNSNYDSGSMRYWIPANNYFSDMPDYPDVTEADCIGWFLQDWKRMEELLTQDWCYIYVDAIVALDGEEIGQSSLGGVESDGEGEYLTEIEISVISEALTNALTHFDGDAVPPAELVELEKLTYDELKPIHELVKESEGSWNPSNYMWRSGYGESLESYLDYIEGEEDEDYQVYIGTELEGEEDAEAS